MLVWSLMVMVAAAAMMRPWPLARAQTLCRTRTVRTGKVFNVSKQAQREFLRFSSTTVLLRHPCERNIAVYLGQQIFFTRDNFESSLLPFTMPEWTMITAPEVTSAHFSGGALLLVVNGKVFGYNYRDNLWFQSQGVNHPVSHVSGDNCCFAKNALCVEISNDIFAYMQGDELAQAHIYFSNNGGYSFDLFVFESQAANPGMLGGIFHFHPLSQIGILIVDKGMAMFQYTDYPLNLSLGMAFPYKDTMNVVLTPGQKGFIILWSQNNLFVSPNSGQLVNTVQLQQEGKIQFPSIFDTNITIHNIAANENELAVLTRESNLFYGNLGFLSTPAVKLVDQSLWSPEAALTFHSSGMLEILTPVVDTAFAAFDFQKCSMNMQAILMDPSLHIEKCKIELLEGQFDEDLYTIDMKSSLLLSAFFIPRPGTSPIPLVMVSNPHSLGLHATMSEFGSTLDGNTQYRLDIKLEQQQHSGRTDPKFTSSIKRPTLSTLTVDVANKDISCVDMKPLSTLISVGCDLRKKIMVQKWQGDELQEEVTAEYVLLEVNGLFTYSYSLTAGSALCHTQPQNWTTIKQDSTTWNRENYVSCWEPSENPPLLWPDVPYQVLGGPTSNEIIFDQRNGIYIFYLSIVDPHYSYCHLYTTFSIYVYGAYPLPVVPPEITIFLLVIGMLLCLWLAYIIPKLLNTQCGLSIKNFWRWLGTKVWAFCTCSLLRSLLRRMWARMTQADRPPEASPSPATPDQDPVSK
ncbi:PREDICTED: cation channel sperm-associated protein subunit delta [Dipodomys ordii]|uniref:Cation channel sperm-associated auxiliary subunit delta n=1 Tax=Dipodomys ordii TaxID=10020 RepID=A0A1S3FQ16_DIPOR|nr:PREDICTED: cation channel sperm-associated protein subunit delta [Dipodomys ordii]